LGPHQSIPAAEPCGAPAEGVPLTLLWQPFWGIFFGQQRFKDFLLARNLVEHKIIQKIIQSKSNTRVSSAFLNQFMNTPLYLKKRAPSSGAIQCLVGGCIGRIRMYKSIGIPNFYYILMDFLGYRVLFGVYKSWLYTQEEEEEEELWGL
jgi:hypothetical protein